MELIVKSKTVCQECNHNGPDRNMAPHSIVRNSKQTQGLAGWLGLIMSMTTY